MTRRKENPANAARNRRQRGYRARLEANEVKPHVLVTPEVVRTLLALGRLKEAQSKDRRRVSEACTLALEEWASEQRLRLMG
jgi:hypothetical protein